jgi:hypothetical protein
MRTQYRIEAIPFYTEKATHILLQEKVQALLDVGWTPLGPPFFGCEMMYQALEYWIDEPSIAIIDLKDTAGSQPRWNWQP